MAKVTYEVIKGTFASWAELFDQAAEIATRVGRNRLIGISHSSEHSQGVVTVWYWDSDVDDDRTGSTE